MALSAVAVVLFVILFVYLEKAVKENPHLLQWYSDLENEDIKEAYKIYYDLVDLFGAPGSLDAEMDGGAVWGEEELSSSGYQLLKAWISATDYPPSVGVVSGIDLFPLVNKSMVKITPEAIRAKLDKLMALGVSYDSSAGTVTVQSSHIQDNLTLISLAMRSMCF